jgi:hypothetical protein
MPTFDFTSPEGKVYSVEGPEGATQAQAFEILQAQIAPTKQDAAASVGIGEDLSKVAGSAPGRILAGVAGLPGDLYHLGLRALGDKLTPESNYGSHAIRKSLGSDYEAQREPGRLLQKAADFAPAVIGGPEALALKLATRVAAPAVASEIGGAVAGPYGELGGALLGAGGATAAARKFQEMAAARKAIPAVPTGEQLLETGSNQFNQARNMELAVKPEFAKKTAQDMRASVETYDPEQIKPVLNAIDRVGALYQPEKRNLYNTLNVDRAAASVPMNEVELARKQLSSLRTSADPTVRAAAKQAQEAITKNQMALTAADAISGDAPLYSKTIRDAVGNYGAGKRSAALTGKQDLAALNAGTAGSGANEDNALRQAVKQLARPINNTNVPVAKKLGFNDPEIAAIKGAAMGMPVGNAARYLGKLAPTGSVSGVLSGGAGFAAAGPLGAIGLPAAGYLAKRIGDLSTKRAVAAVDSLVRSRSPLAAQVAAQLPPQIVQQLPAKTQRLLQGLILADPILSQPRQPVGQPAAQ